MSNDKWEVYGRSNYVHLVDIGAFTALVNNNGLHVHQKSDDPTLYCISSTEAGFPEFYLQEPPTDNNRGRKLLNLSQKRNIINSTLNPINMWDVMNHIAENEVFILQESGNVKSKYVNGTSIAYIRRNGSVEVCNFTLNDIYVMAHKEFMVPLTTISRAMD